MRKQNTIPCIGIGLIVLFFVASSIPSIAQNQEKIYKESSLEVSADYRQFFNKGVFPAQKSIFFSSAIKPSFYAEWEEGKVSSSLQDSLG